MSRAIHSVRVAIIPINNCVNLNVPISFIAPYKLAYHLNRAPLQFHLSITFNWVTLVSVFPVYNDSTIKCSISSFQYSIYFFRHCKLGNCSNGQRSHISSVRFSKQQIQCLAIAQDAHRVSPSSISIAPDYCFFLNSACMWVMGPYYNVLIELYFNIIYAIPK